MKIRKNIRAAAAGARARAGIGRAAMLMALLSQPAFAQATQGTMDMTGPLGITMNRMGSGTSWVPDASPFPGLHKAVGAWSLMLHGAIHLQYINEDGPRGDSQVGSLNWLMLMASRDVAGGTLQWRTMVSAEPATVTKSGYPLLLQTGETVDDAPLHDRQHPHDAWMELGAAYERAIGSRMGWSLYAAAAGEPALGPVAYMHRPSALDNPLAPLSHHWQDATHVTFGVLTAGVFTRAWKFEGSAFNGREPDEDRWDLDLDQLDSYSGRVTYSPSQHWSMSAGYGFLRSPERLAPEGTAHRTTASVLHARTFGPDRRWATSLVWGRNAESGHAAATNALLAESQVTLRRTHTVFARVEFVEKSAEELVLPEDAGFDHDAVYNLAGVSLGYVREMGRAFGFSGAIGVRGGLSFIPGALSSEYGSRSPLGGMIFVRVRPSQAPAAAGMMHQHE